MKLATTLALAVVFTAGNISLIAQTQPNLANGITPQGSYDSTSVDEVNLVNGNLTLHIPLPFDYPQRGKLGIKYYLVVNAKTWAAGGDPNTMTGQWNPTSGCGTAPASGPCGQGPVFASTASFAMTRIWQSVFQDGVGTSYSATGPDGLVTWDGSSHSLNAGTTFDTSGYRVVMSGDDGNGVPNTATIIDRNGTQYIGGFFGGDCSTDPGNGLPGSIQTTTCFQHFSLGSVVDANGNILNPTVPIPNVDTNGSPSILAHAAVGSESAGCFASFGTPWVYYFTYPAPNGQSNQIKLCFSPYPQLATSFSQPGVHQFQDVYSGHPFPGGWRPPVYLTNVILPDNTQWSISYDSYGEITSVGTPTGASIQYAWSEGSFPRCNVAGNDITKVSRAVHSRTVTDVNSHAFIWNYQWTPQAGDGTLTHIVTDPNGHDTDHVFVDLTASQTSPTCDFRETKTTTYQGTGGTRTPLQQVDTTWLMKNDGGLGVPSDVKTTVFPSQKVSLEHRDYDPSSPTLGVVISKKNYDWGQGSPGALLREEDTVYEWQKDSRYLTANLLDLPASSVVISPIAAANTKASCPVDGLGTLKACMTETDYTYDEAAYLTNYEITVGALPTGSHGAAPNPVRGNPTTVSKWLSTGSVVSHVNWYDTGMAFVTTDPLGHNTTYSYDLAYKGMLPTKTCNAKNQCVSATYDVNTGLMASFTDANGSYSASGTTQGDPAHTSTYGHDFMSRPTSTVSAADAQGQHPQTALSYPSATTVQKLTSITSAMNDSSTSHEDGLGHVSGTEHVTPGGNALVDITYDGLGHVKSTTNPYYTTSDPTYGIIQTSYDGLGRVTSVTEQDGSIKRVAYNVATTIAVNGDCIITTDEAGTQRGICSDALGRLVEVDEPNPANPINVNYKATLLTDGNFVLENAAGTGIWSTGTYGTNASSIYMQDDGNLVLYIFKWSAGTYATPSPGPFPVQGCSIGSYLLVNQRLNSNQCLVSPHGQYLLYMGSDGNFYIYDVAHNVGTWGPGTYGHPGAYAIMQGDGNLCVYTATNTFLWCSGTGGTNADRLNMEDDGRIIIYKSAWNSGTGGQPYGTALAHPGCDAGIGTGWTGILASGQCFVSPNGRFELLMQGDGNLVIYDLSVTPNKALWSSGTAISTADPGFAMRTLYSYDALGNLLSVDQKGTAPSDNTQWRSRTFTYDSLSRVLTSSNPESGIITYTYDADGELLHKTSPAPGQTGSATQTVSYCYDFLHRVTGRGYGAQSCPLATPIVTYVYDSGTNAIGYLTSMTDQAGIATYTYDTLGRLATETRPIAGISKSTSYTYNLNGSIKTLTYPSGRIVTYTPDSAGRLVSAVDNNGTNYVSSASYNPDGSLKGLVNGSTPALNLGLQYTPRLQLCRITAFTSGTLPTSCTNSQNIGNIMDRGYDLHAGNGTPGSGSDNGNVFGITNYRDASRSQTFTYDALNRLASGSSSANTGAYSWGENYSVDAWGNLQISPIGTKAHGGNFTLSGNAQNRPTGLAYDAAGNLMSYSSATYVYDQENRLSSTAGMSYTYDGNGERVLKSNTSTGAAVKRYWLMGGKTLAEGDGSSNLTEEFIYFGSTRVARIDLPANTVHYYLSDHLGSTSIVISAAGAVEQDSDYSSYGTEFPVTSGPNTYKFTGKERDTESNIDYFGARYFSSLFGRFTTPDDGSDQSPIDPQSWNLYGYVRNNPTSNTDPDGHDCVVQTRTDDHTETVTVFTGSCDKVKIGDGQSKTYVPGTVTGVSRGAGGTSIDIAYKPDDGSAQVVVFSASSAPIPDRPGLAYGYNAAGYHKLGVAGATMNDGRTYALWSGASALAAGCVLGCPTAGTALLNAGRLLYYTAAGILPAVPSAIEKLQKLGMSVPEANELIENPTTQRLIDNANNGNINYIADVGGKLVRITTDPGGQRIISAGIVQARNITNGIASGRFTK